MSVTQTEQILQAAEGLEQGEVIGLGDYAVSSNGNTSPAKKSVLADAFVSFHDIESGDKISVWMHSTTGALIILPGDAE